MSSRLCRISKHALLIGTAGVGLLVITGRSAEPQNSGTRKMAALLAKIADEADAHPEENPFWNHKRAQAIRAALDSGTIPASQRQTLRTTAAKELLWAGETEAALVEFSKLFAESAHAAPAVRTELRRWLALSYLRLGEQENCIRSHNVESCLLPIRPAGYHAAQRGSRLAVEQLSTLLRADPDDLTSRWLINIAYMTLGEYPGKVPGDWVIPPEAFESGSDLPPFTDVAPALGIDRAGLAGGAIMEDFDGDGYLDVMASSSGLRDQVRYYRNNGDGTFAERTREAGLCGITGGLNLVHSDFDNDGHPDVLVLRGGWMKKGGNHPKSLLRNNGDGTFEDVTEKAGLLKTMHPTQTAAWADYDGDGWLDLYVGYESEPGHQQPCELYRNNHDGTFREVGAAAGVASTGYVKAVTWGDYDNDGRPDLYLSRLGAANVLYHNDDGGRFSDLTVRARVNKQRDSFPTWFFDYDNDGWLDLFVSGWRAPNSVADVAADYLDLPYEGETPRLYHNNRDGSFSDVTEQSGLNHLLLAMGSNYGDIDNDGWPDIYLGTGAPDLAMLIPNRMFRNAEGKSFQDVTTATRTGHLQKGHGVAFGDIDNDGDQDIYEVVGGAFYGDSYRNVLFLNPGNRNHWITLRLEGTRSNRLGAGTRIRVRVDTASGPRDIFAIAGTGGSFGGSSLQQEIGLGAARAIVSIELFWPASGLRQTIRNLTMDQILQIREGRDTAVPVKLKRLTFAPGSGNSTQGHHVHAPAREARLPVGVRQHGLWRTGAGLCGREGLWKLSPEAVRNTVTIESRANAAPGPEFHLGGTDSSTGGSGGSGRRKVQPEHARWPEISGRPRRGEPGGSRGLGIWGERPGDDVPVAVGRSHVSREPAELLSQARQVGHHGGAERARSGFSDRGARFALDGG